MAYLDKIEQLRTAYWVHFGREPRRVVAGGEALRRIREELEILMWPSADDVFGLQVTASTMNVLWVEG